jgi:hypothetical protein
MDDLKATLRIVGFVLHALAAAHLKFLSPARQLQI